jgi:phosphocarrier protein HPr
MRQSNVTVGWPEGLHMRAAAKIVRSAQRFNSTVLVRFCGQVANARNILSVIALCAAMGAVLEIEAVGDDEQDALAAVESAFNLDPVAPEKSPGSIRRA